MKKYKFIVISFTLCILIFFITYNSSLIRPYLLGSINERHTSNTSRNSVVSLSLEEEDTIKIIYDVTVKEGILKIQLEDSSGNIMENFEVNHNGNKEVLIEEKGSYELSAIFEDFKGDCRININK